MRNSFCCLLVCCVCLIATSCTSTKTVHYPAYFKNLKADTTIQAVVNSNFDLLIQPGDVLAITVSSLAPVEDAYFNLAAGELVMAGAETGAKPGFLVSSNGAINYHKLGMVKAAGLSRQALAKNLQVQLEPYLRSATVNINFLNRKVTVMGAVGSPRVLPLQNEQISLTDALVLSGGISPDARYNDVMIIRNNAAGKEVKHLNLEDEKVFNSPWFYLNNNDIVYVMTDNERLEKGKRKANLQTTLSLVASGVGLFIIVVDRILK